MVKVALGMLAVWGFGGIFTPELLGFLTAAMLPLNTFLLIAHSRMIRRRLDEDIQPRLDEAADSATKAANIVERRHLHEPTGGDRRG